MRTERLGKRIRTDRGHGEPRRPAAEKKPRRDRAERFLDIICLLAGGQEWPAKRLSEELAVTSRTVLRDMKALEARGLVTRSGGRGSAFRLAGDTSWERPQLSLREIVALLALAGQGSFVESESQAATAWAAVTKLIPLQLGDIRQRLEELTKLLAAQPAESRAWLCRQNWLPVLVEAIVNHRALRVWTNKETPPAGNPRLLVPTKIETISGQWYVRGYEVGGTEIPVVGLAQVAHMILDAESG